MRLGRTARLSAAVAVALVAACGPADRQTAQPPPPTAQATPGAPAPATQRRAAGGTRTTRPTPQPTAAPTTVPAARGVEAVALARSPRELAQILTVAETTIRDERVTGLALAEAAHTQQRVYRRLTLTPRWREQVLRNLPRGLRPMARLNMGAGVSLSSLVTPQPKLPDWRIVKPAPSPKLLRAYREAAARFNLDWEYLAAINLVETRMGRIRGKSTAGAQGPMQFMPATWDAYGRGDINDPKDAITAAARYLAASGAPQDMPGALWSYNNSDRYVEAVTNYARVLQADPRAYRGYYHWQVYYVTPDGDVHLPEGYGS